MLDRLDELKNMAAKFHNEVGVDFALGEGEVNNDRELIDNFMVYTRDV